MEKNLPSQFLELAKKRYSCRAFDARPVPDNMVESILEAARYAPSAVNKQPVHVWVADTTEALDALSGATNCLYGAPLVFVVGCNPAEAWVRACDGKNAAEIDAAIAGTHIMMEAADLGLGSVWVGSFDPGKVKAAFPELAEWEIVALFPVGYPAPEGKASERHAVRKNLEDFASEL